MEDTNHEADRTLNETEFESEEYRNDPDDEYSFVDALLDKSTRVLACLTFVFVLMIVAALAIYGGIHLSRSSTVSNEEAPNKTVQGNVTAPTERDLEPTLAPNQVIVFVILGEDIWEACRHMTEDGLEVDVVYQYSNEFPAGKVIDVIPQNGTAVCKGSRVTLVESLGRREVNIPDVTGKTYSEAAQILHESHVSIIKRWQLGERNVNSQLVLWQNCSGAYQKDTDLVWVGVVTGDEETDFQRTAEGEVYLPDNNWFSSEKALLAFFNWGPSYFCKLRSGEWKAMFNLDDWIVIN